jgi:predicted RNA binding protein YcfA (HicA-like mRNA interferase family)
MGRWMPCKRKDFIKKLRSLGFEPPEPGGKHFYTRHGTFTFTLPGNAEFSVPQLRTLLKEIELGLRRNISLNEWQDL